MSDEMIVMTLMYCNENPEFHSFSYYRAENSHMP